MTDDWNPAIAAAQAAQAAQQSFALALAAFQAELPKVGKDQTATVKSDKGNYSYDYADLALIQSIAMPLLGPLGLSFSAKPTLNADGAFVLRYALRHSGGHEDAGEYPLPDPARSSPQQIGSAITYGRRYAFCAVTGIAPSGEDDDGQHASDARARAVESFETAKPATRSKAGDPRNAELLAQIKVVRELLAMTAEDVQADFSAFSSGVIITAADPQTLTNYLNELKSRAAA